MPTSQRPPCQQEMAFSSQKDGSALDSTRMGSSSPSAAAATTARQAADDDAEEGDDGVDDSLETGGNGVHNGHDAVANCAKLERWC
ncbi:hypothetical protein IAQ61_008720 [Plenodomus lingam]|uniref:uncharacterized protein n=1 Tax=Leptosphaeria maculans TaxID=5022 RepID=UPI003330C9F5|nr:hypothetical protein IAQ61_008720 [Plenodomus lingam]